MPGGDVRGYDNAGAGESHVRLHRAKSTTKRMRYRFEY